MLHPGRPHISSCPHGDSHQSCQLSCKYNRFEGPDLRIDSWELKCLDCGHRETIAFRSDELAPEVDPTQCPFCQLRVDCSGRNPCLG